MKGIINNHGFTLTELLTALLITTIIGAVVVSVGAGLYNVQEHTDGITEVIQSGRSGMMRLCAILRKAKLITAATDSEMAIWSGDSNGNKKIEIDEIMLVRYLPDQQIVERWRVSFPETMPHTLREALNQPQALATLTDVGEVKKILSKAIYSPYLSKEPVITSVSDFNIHTAPAAPITRLVSVHITLGQNDKGISLVSATRLRADMTGSIVWRNGKPVLQTGYSGSNGSSPGDGDKDDHRPIPPIRPIKIHIRPFR